MTEIASRGPQGVIVERRAAELRDAGRLTDAQFRAITDGRVGIADLNTAARLVDQLRNAPGGQGRAALELKNALTSVFSTQPGLVASISRAFGIGGNGPPR